MLRLSFLYETYYSHLTKNSCKRLRPWIKLILAIILVGLIAALFWSNHLEFWPAGWGLFVSNIKKIFQIKNINTTFPSTNLWLLSWQFLLNSLTSLFLGTIIGWISAFITAVALYKQFSWKACSYLIWMIILGLRAFPVLVFIQLFSVGFNSAIAAIIIFWWFTWLWLHKYFIQMLNGCDFHVYSNSQMLGKSRFVGFYQFVWPTIKSRLFLFFIFAIESNMRWLSILSALGIKGIGSLIYQPIISNQNSYDQIFIPFLFLFGSLIWFEILTFFYEYKCLQIKKIKIWNKHALAKNNYQINIFACLFLIAIIGIVIYGLSTLQSENFDANITKFYWNRIFDVNISSWKSNDWSINSWLLLLPIIQQTVSILIASFILGLLFGTLSSFKVVHPAIATFFLIFNLLMRSLPTVLLFYLFDPIFNLPITTVLVVLTFHSTFVFAKKINASLQIILKIKIKHQRSLDYSWWIIYFNYIYPVSKQEAWNYFKFDFENTLRSVILFGVFGASLFGQYLNAFSERNSQAWAAFIWTLWIFIVCQELIQITWKNKFWNLIKQKFINKFYDLKKLRFVCNK